MEKLRGERWLGSLRTRIFRILLHDKIRNNGIGTDPHVLRLHGADGPDLLAADRHYWFLRGLRFHPKDLRRGEDRLVNENFLLRSEFTASGGIYKGVRSDTVHFLLRRTRNSDRAITFPSTS